MTEIPPGFHDLFEKATVAHFVTMTADGTPHATPVWIDYDADAARLLVNTERGRRKERNVRTEPTVAASMTDPDDPYRALSVTGTVTGTTTEGAREHIDTLTRRYTDKDRYYETIETERVVLRIRPDEVFTKGG